MHRKRYDNATAIRSGTDWYNDKGTKYVKRSIVLSSIAAWCCLGLMAQGYAAPPAVTVAAGLAK